MPRPRSPFRSVHATPDEVAATVPGDEIVPAPDVVMDRGFTLAAAPDQVWPWFAQLGRRRAGWYLPRRVERLLPRGGRGFRHIDPGLQKIAIGDVIPDWPGRDDTFELCRLDPPHVLVHRSRRGDAEITWAIVLTAVGTTEDPATRVHLRLRAAPLEHRRIVEIGGGLLDLVTVAGLAAGLRERVTDRVPAGHGAGGPRVQR